MANALGGVLLAGMAPIFMLAAIGFLLTVQIYAYQPIMVTSQFDTTNLVLRSHATIVSADANGAFVAGYTNATGLGRYWIGHFDQTGRVEWSTRLGVEGDSVRSISAGGTGVYVVAVVNDSWVLAQFTNGNQVWTRPLDIANGYVSSVNGNAYVVGNESMSVFNSMGSQLASYSIKFNGIPMGASADSSGVYVLTSSVLGRLSLDGSGLWTAPLVKCSAFGLTGAISSLAVTNGMEFVDNSGCLIAYDSSGRLIWNVPVTCTDQSSGQESWISADSAGVYSISGSYTGPTCLTRYDYSGHQVSGFNLPQAWRVSSISARESAIYVAGAVESYVLPSVLLARLGFSNDLILLGLHSPFSFLLIALVVGLVCLGVFRYRRRRRSQLKIGLVKEYRFDGPVD
ncbi:MAG TPA: hypothetical protein VFV92_09645 [Candidatus Bathyarchaeia archaeon]|nr:hypothetical protein [Candidatus Bathyarchaeia archaeon]